MDTWKELNNKVRNATIEECLALDKEEKENGNRQQFRLRIHSRLNKVRADTEREKIIAESPK